MSYHYSPQYTALYLRRESFARYSSCNWGFRPDGSQDFSLALWFWPDNPNARLLDGMNALSLDLMDDRLVFWLKGYTDLICYADRYPILRHEWNHVAITYNNQGQIFFYINGMQTQVYSVFQKTPAKLWGDILFCPGMEGYLRGVQFFDKQLSEVEVDQVKRGIVGAPTPIRWFDFETSAPQERITGTPLALEKGAQPYALADGLFCDNSEGFFPLDGDTVNPAAHQDAPYTVQAWISIYDEEQSFAILFMNGRHTLDCGMVLYLEKDVAGYHLCAGRGAHTRQENILRAPHIIPTRSWHNVAVTYDGEKMCIYVDGRKEGETAELVPFTEHLEHGQLRIGTDDLPGLSGNEGSFHGAFGNIIVFQRALSPAELEQYAAEAPIYGVEGLIANYTFTRYACCNLVNGYEVSTAGVDTSKICRNPITEDFVQIFAPRETAPNALPQLGGRTAEKLHQARATALPSAGYALQAAWPGGTIDGRSDALRSDLEAYLARLRTGAEKSPFYYSEQTENGEYHFYYVADQIYLAGCLKLDSRGEFAAWLVRLLSTLILDVFSIYCAVPKAVAIRIPQALQEGLLNERAVWLYQSVKDTGLKDLVSTVSKFLLSGGLLIHILEQIQREGLWLVGANLATMVASFLIKAGTAWGWITVVVRVAFLIVDLVSLWNDRPKLLGAELLQLRFQTGGIFAAASSGPGTSLTPHWQGGQESSTSSPVVCCLRQARGAPVQVTAQFAVYTNGSYQITASASPKCPLGNIQEKSVCLQAGKDGTCTVSLTFTDGLLDHAGIGDFTSTLRWTIKGGGVTTTQEIILRLFLIYDFPQPPWGDKSGFGTPWVDVLAFACGQAKDVTGDSDAEWRRGLVRAVIQGLWRHCTGYMDEAVYVSGANLHLTRWLVDIRRGTPALHAHDCAALLVVLCNLLGCNLSSVLLCGPDGEKLQSRELITIGGGMPTKHLLDLHETVMELRGILPYYSDPCYQMPGEDGQMQNPVMRPFHTSGDVMGFCEMFLQSPDRCVVPSDRRAIGNGRRTIL